MSIDYNTIATPSNQSPGALPRDGSKKSVIDYWHTELKEGRNRPYKEVTFSATVLYSALLSAPNFINKYDLSFVMYVLGGGGEVMDSFMDNKTVLETIVFIPEICGCLPRPPSGHDEKFYKFLQSLTVKNKKQGFDQAAQSSKRNKKFPTRFLENMKMFPRAYTLVDKTDKAKSRISINSKVRVRFPYDYDVYAGIIVDNPGK